MTKIKPTYRLLQITVLLMFLLPLFPSYAQPYVVIAFSGIALFVAIQDKTKFKRKKFVVNASIYFCMLISLIYSYNLEFAWQKLQTMSPLLIFPLTFAFLPPTVIEQFRNKRNELMFTYLVAILVLNLCFFFYHFGHYRSGLLIHYPTVTNIAQGAYNIHPIYLSTYLCVAIIFSFFLLKEEKSRLRIFLLLFIDVLLLSFLMILMKKGPILGLVIVFTTFVLIQKNKQIWYTYFLILSVYLLAVFSIPELRGKFKEILAIEDIKNGNLTSTNIRYSIYSYAKIVVAKSPIIGHGIGDYKDELINVYKEKSPTLFLERYNSHNQYLSFLISTGLIGLTAFLIMLIYNFIYGIRFKNQVLILLILFYCCIMLFENLLERQTGVIMFSFFIQFFSLFNIKKE